MAAMSGSALILSIDLSVCVFSVFNKYFCMENAKIMAKCFVYIYICWEIFHGAQVVVAFEHSVVSTIRTIFTFYISFLHIYVSTYIGMPYIFKLVPMDDENNIMLLKIIEKQIGLCFFCMLFSFSYNFFLHSGRCLLAIILESLLC